MTAAVRPWLLIDVDGVLNPLTVAGDFDLYELAPPGHPGPPLTLQLTSRHGEWLSALAGLFDLAWATTWEANANRLISPAVGLPDDLPVIPFAEPSLRHEWGISFKSPAVARWVGGRPFVWLDDSITDADTAWFSEVPGIGDFRLIPVDPTVGLQPEHCGEARAWAEARS